MLGDPQQRRPCTMYQLAPQVMIGSVPDTTEPWLSAGRVLSRNQSNPGRKGSAGCDVSAIVNCGDEGGCDNRSEEHTSELQSLMRISYAVFCLKKKKHQVEFNNTYNTLHIIQH